MQHEQVRALSAIHVLSALRTNGLEVWAANSGRAGEVLEGLFNPSDTTIVPAITKVRVYRSSMPVGIVWTSDGCPLGPPSEYDLKLDVEFREHEYPGKGQNSVLKTVYDFHMTRALLPRCLTFADALAIQAKGSGVYRCVFGEDTYLFFLNGFEFDEHGKITIPYSYLASGRVQIAWADPSHQMGRNACVPVFKGLEF